MVKNSPIFNIGLKKAVYIIPKASILYEMQKFMRCGGVKYHMWGRLMVREKKEWMNSFNVSFSFSVFFSFVSFGDLGIILQLRAFVQQSITKSEREREWK